MANDNVIPPGMTRAQWVNSLDPRSPTFETDFQKAVGSLEQEYANILPDTLAQVKNIHERLNNNLTGTAGTSGTGDVQGSWKAETDAMVGTGQAFGALNNVMDAVNRLQSTGGPGCCCPSEPDPADSGQPEGSLSADKDGVVTTPGGYKIEATGQFNWRITGPDGKKTDITGDPHVTEGDGGKWDFKRDSTFVLGDGTRINVSTKPYGNGMTVSDNLEIIAGNQRVNISDVAAGKGKTGAITNDGYAHVNTFGNKDAFVMGKESDDWSFQGKEVIGSNNGGDSFKLGNDLPAGVVKPAVEHANSRPNFFTQIYESLAKIAQSLEQAMLHSNKPYTPPSTDLQKLLDPSGRGCWDPSGRLNGDLLKGYGQVLEAVGKMFEALGNLVNLTNNVRRPPPYQLA